MDGSRAMRKALFFALCMGVASFVGCDDEGDFCVFDNDCKSGLCVNNMCIGVIKPVGYGCDSDGDCKSGLCYNGSCRATNKHNGEFCRIDLECKSGFCYENECSQKNLKNGEACVDNVQCKSGYCGFLDKICTEKPGAPQACRRDSECALGVCVNGFCARYNQ